MQALDRAIDIVTDVGTWLAAVLLGVIVCFFWLEVVARYFFSAPPGFTSSLSPHFMLMAVMLMLPWLSREGYHVAMSFIFDRTPPAFAKRIGIAIAALSALVCLLSAWMSADETWRQYISNTMTMDQFIFPLWRVTAFMVYGFLFAAIHFARQAITGSIAQRGEM